MSAGTSAQWESTLRQWVKKSSDNEDQKRDRTEAEIRQAFAGSSRIQGVRPKIYVKGSYANNTNVRLDYDVDIAVECQGLYYYDSEGAEADVDLARRMAKSAGDYVGPYGGVAGAARFKADVRATLADYFGASAIMQGKLSLRVREKKTTLPADVVPCFEYRRLTGLSWQGDVEYVQGTRLYPDSGPYVHNWPNQQYECGVKKNNETRRQYKRMVRAVKRVENELVKAKKIQALPSFFMECLVYNVDNIHFDHESYVGDMRAVLATIFNATASKDACDTWLEASEMKWLFGYGQSWTRQQANALAASAWDYFGLE